MSTIYKIIGEDGKEYGWVEAGQLRQWIAENRIEHQTPIFVDGAKDWNFVGRLPEFASCFPSRAPQTIAPPKPGNPMPGRMPKTNSFATAGLVFGILSLPFLCCCGGIPFNIPGLIFSIIALIQISERPEFYKGRNLAIAGLILSAASLLFLLVALGSGHSNIVINGGKFP
ncbi:MAG TPA: DUF4190 domain-containing protein [Verrucomicrobiae bacterium]